MKERLFKLVPIVILFGLFILITTVYYWGIGKVYFQQDEWFKTGKSLYYMYADFEKLWTNKFGFHYYPLLNSFFILEYLIFKLHVSYYLYMGVLLQGVTATLFYLLSKRLFGSKLLSFMLSILFLINPEIHQVMFNEMVSSIYKIVLGLMLILFILFFDQISKGKELKTRTILVLCIFYAVSTFFFEGMLVLIALVPVFYLLFKSHKTFISFKKRNILILAGTVIFTILRLVLQAKLPVDAPLPIQGSLLLTTMYNAATTPFKFLVQYLFGLQSLNFLGDMYSQKIFSYLHEPGINLAIISITTGYEIAVYFITIMLLCIAIIILVLSFSKSNTYKRAIKVLIFSVIWLITNSIVIAPQGRIFTSIESRYLYISGAGVLWVLGSLLFVVWDRYKDNILVKNALACGVLVYICVWGVYSYYVINIEKQKIINVSLVRQHIVNQFTAMYPTLPDTSVFYMYCSDDCTSNQMYGMPKEWVVPFQNGLGWVLLTVYSTDNPRKYAPFFSNYALWDSKSVEYRKIGKTTFGFFTDLKALKKTMKENSFSASDIIVLSYESKKYKLTLVKNQKKILFPETHETEKK